MKTIWTIAAVGMLLTACSTPELVMSEPLQQNYTRYTVDGRTGWLINQHLSFGDYYTGKVDRSWTKGPSFEYSIFNLVYDRYEKRKQTFQFNMHDLNGNKSQVYALSQVDMKDLGLGANPVSPVNILMDMAGWGDAYSNVFAASIFINDEAQPYEVFLDNDAAHRRNTGYYGFAGRGPDDYYKIMPVNTISMNGKTGNALGTVGFELRNPEGVAVAAVNMMDKGIVYMGKTDAREQFLLANIISAMLLQENLDATL